MLGRSHFQSADADRQGLEGVYNVSFQGGGLIFEYKKYILPRYGRRIGYWVNVPQRRGVLPVFYLPMSVGNRGNWSAQAEQPFPITRTRT